jgi:CHAD domain-containing protein
LHDFRVALRRLRSCLRAYRPYLRETVPKKLRRRLRRLARATSAARDAEVQLAWLKRQSQRLTPAQAAGGRWLTDRLETCCRQAYDAIRTEVLTEYAGAARRLRHRLQAGHRRPGSTSINLAAAAARLEKYVSCLTSDLGLIRGAKDREEIHAARIAVKHLRYLLEPFGEHCPAVARRLRELKHLQECFGALCDAQVAAQELATAVQVAGAERPRRKLRRSPRTGGSAPADPLPGLLVLAKRAHQEINNRYRALAPYLGGRRAKLTSALLALAPVLAARPDRVILSRPRISRRLPGSAPPAAD